MTWLLSASGNIPDPLTPILVFLAFGIISVLTMVILIRNIPPGPEEQDVCAKNDAYACLKSGCSDAEVADGAIFICNKEGASDDAAS